MGLFSKHWARIAVTLLPLVFALLHAARIMPIPLLQTLDDIIYDMRLRATMPRTLDERIVIVDIDEKSLSEVGHWPWGRNRVAALVNELFERQKIAVLGFDVVFAEPDESSGLKHLNDMAANELRDNPDYVEKLKQLQGPLDYDALFAKALDKRPIVLGYYFSGSDREGRSTGKLPSPVMSRDALQGRPIVFTKYQGYGSNIPQIARAAPLAGFFNPIVESDGVVRSIPFLAEYANQYYESLSAAVYRYLIGLPAVSLGFPPDKTLGRKYQSVESVVLTLGDKRQAIPVDDRVSTLIPYRGPGGQQGGSFKYFSASDVLEGKLVAGSLKDKIVLVGSTAPGLQDQRVTPVGETYPGVEAHANVISGLLDGVIVVKPDWIPGYEVTVLIIAGLILALALPLLSAPRAVMLSAGVIALVIGINSWLYLASSVVLPLASSLIMAITAFGLNMSYGYFVESRSKRELAQLFGTYVPPELVDEMVKDPDAYSMTATSRELTVMFCDMRGFTKMSERMEPTQLQELLNAVFSRLTSIIRSHRGTIDKYMGDCVMAFWGAPVETPDHAQLAVKAAVAMAAMVQQINQEHRAKGIPEIGVGIGLNTGSMCVGDMGSDIRRSYTVIGDAVNLASRLEGLSKMYGTDIVVSEATRAVAVDFSWQELDKVRVKGKDQAVSVFQPWGQKSDLNEKEASELKAWVSFVKAYRAQNWDQCDMLMFNLLRMNANKYLYQVYAERVASMKLLPFDPAWDGATNYETK